jgi:hypothetical protein
MHIDFLPFILFIVYLGAVGLGIGPQGYGLGAGKGTKEGVTLSAAWSPWIETWWIGQGVR